MYTAEQLLDMALFGDRPPEGYVRREGLIFQVGNYPDKKFSLTQEEADRAIANFTPVQGDLEHTPTVLSGNLGIMRQIRRDGNAIFGTADVPTWLDNILKGSASSISCAWDRSTKALKGWGWTLDPRIEGAALMSAFAEFSRTQGSTVNTPGQQDTAPVIFNQQQENRRRFMPLAELLKNRLRATFNTGATDPTNPPTQPNTSPTLPQAPSVPPVQPTAPTSPETGAPGTSVPLTQPNPPQAPTNPPAGGGAGGPGLALYTAQPIDEETAAFKAEQIMAIATDAADDLIRQGALHSSGRNAAIAAFASAGYDNESSGPSVVMFSRKDGTEIKDRVQMLKEVFKSVPQHTLFARELPVHVLNGNKADNERVSAEEQGKAQAEEFNKGLAARYGQNGNGNNNGNGTKP